MKLLMLSTDRNLFTDNSAVSNRIKILAESYDQAHIIIFSLKNNSFTNKTIGDNIFLYPTNSHFRILYLINAIILGFKIIKSYKFYEEDLITCQDPFEVGLAGYILKKFSKVSLELQIHTDLYSPYFVKHSFLNSIRVLISRLILSQAKTIRVVSKRIADSLIERGINESKIVIRPIKVDTEILKSKPISFDLHKKFPTFRKIIIIVSRLETEKNIDNAIKAFSLLVAQNIDFGLIIVGSGREMPRLKKLAHRLKIGPQVVFEGWQDDLVSYYKGCDVVLVTSWYEGYGLVYKEAEAMGCKIVSTDVGIAREVGATIVGWKPEEIVNGLRKVLS